MSNYDSRIAEALGSIADGSLRGFVRQAVTRADEISWPFFFALRCSEHEPVICFDAALSVPASEFLRDCAQRSFPRGRPTVEFSGRARYYTEITDRELRGALENAIVRAEELGFWCFADLIIGRPGWERKRLEFCLACNIPRELAMGLHGFFEKSIIGIISSDFGAPRWNEPPKPEN